MTTQQSEHNKPVLNRDLQILIGEQIVAGINGHYVCDGTFNLFVATPTIRSAAIKALSKLTIFTLNECQARISSTDGKKHVLIDFKRLKGYVYLKHLVELLMNCCGRFFTELYLISLKGMDVAQLFDILAILKDLSVISLPYEFDNFTRNGGSKKLDKLIERNAKTLQSLHHLTYPFPMLPEMRNKMLAINSSTLRTGSLEKEADFFAFYMDKDRCPSDLLPGENGVSMRIRIHRCRELFRSIKRALQRDKLRSDITMLSICSIYDFDTKSAQLLLSQIERIRSTLPSLNSLVLELRTLECYPNCMHYGLGNDDGQDWEDEMDLVPPSASVCSSVATFVLDWLREQNFDFKLDVHVQLAVDYQYGKDPGNELLEKTMRETVRSSLGFYWAKLMRSSASIQNGTVTSNATIKLNDRTSFEFNIEFRSITVSVKPGYHEKNIFRLVHSL